MGLSFYVGQLLEFLQMMLFVLYKVCLPAWPVSFLCSQCFPSTPSRQRADFAWSSTIDPLETASHYTVPAAYFKVADSPAFYLALVVLAGAWGRGHCRLA